MIDEPLLSLTLKVTNSRKWDHLNNPDHWEISEHAQSIADKLKIRVIVCDGDITLDYDPQ